MYTNKLQFAFAAVLMTLVTIRASGQVRPFGDLRVIAAVPAPGFPEGIATHDIPTFRSRVPLGPQAIIGQTGNWHFRELATRPDASACRPSFVRGA